MLDLTRGMFETAAQLEGAIYTTDTGLLASSDSNLAAAQMEGARLALINAMNKLLMCRPKALPAGSERQLDEGLLHLQEWSDEGREFLIQGNRVVYRTPAGRMIDAWTLEQIG